MPRMISRARLAIKKIAKKARWSPFSRNKASRGAGASSSDSPFQNPGPSRLPAEPLFIHCYPNVSLDMCYCRECVYGRAAPQLPDEHPDYDLAQVSVGLPQPFPPSVVDVTPPTSPSVTGLPDLRAARTDEELFSDIDQWCSKHGFLPEVLMVPNSEHQIEVLSTASEPSEPVIALSPNIMSPPNLLARTDEELFSDIEELFLDIEQWYSKHGFLPEDPTVPSTGERPEAPVSTTSAQPPAIITFAEPQPTLSAIMYLDFYGLLPLYSDTVEKLRWEEEEPFATGTGRVLEVPDLGYRGDDDDDDDDDSSETVTLQRLSAMKMSGGGEGI